MHNVFFFKLLLLSKYFVTYTAHTQDNPLMPLGKRKTCICFLFKELSWSAFLTGHSRLFFWSKANRKILWKNMIVSLSIFKDQGAHNNWEQREKLQVYLKCCLNYMVIVLFNHGTSDFSTYVGGSSKMYLG